MSPAFGLPRARAARSMKTWKCVVLVVLSGVSAFVAGGRFGVAYGQKQGGAISVGDESIAYSMTRDDWGHTPSNITSALQHVDNIAARFQCSRGDVWDAIQEMRNQMYDAPSIPDLDKSWSGCALLLEHATMGPTPLRVNVMNAASEVGQIARARDNATTGVMDFREKHGLRYN